MSFDNKPSPLRTKQLQSKRIKHEHPAFEDSDSEDENGMTKAMQFQLLLRQEAQRQDLNASPLSSNVSPESISTHSKLLHAIESPFKHLPKPHLPKHLPHFRHENKPQFLIVSESEAPSPGASATTELVPSRPSPPIVTSAAQLPPPPPPPLFPPPSPPHSPVTVSPSRVRPRRNTLPEAVPEHTTTTFALETLRSRRHRSFDFEAPVIVDEPTPQPGQTAQGQDNIPIPNPTHLSSSWRNSSASTRVISVQDVWMPTFTPSIRDSIATPLSPPIPGFVETPLGLGRFEKPKLELRTVDLIPDLRSERSTETMQSAVRRREKLRKPAATRNVQISAPASLETATDLMDFQTAPPRTPPLPPKPSLSPPGTPNGSTQLSTGGTVVWEENRTSDASPSRASRTGTTKSNESTRKVPRFSVVAKVAGRLLRPPTQRNSSSSSTTAAARPALPPLLYSSSTPIEKHILAVSTRIKDEFKMKLKNEADLPLVDAGTEEELIQQLQDVNEDVAGCAKELVKLLQQSGTSAADKRESKSDKAKKALDIQGDIRTSLNSFLVARVFQPFSIQLSPEDDEAVRQRYEEIAPSVPQFIASRWRVVASASTSRPVQELGPVIANLAAEVTAEILNDRVSEAELARETMALLVPLVRHAYLLAHFNHLEMVTADYDIFLGTDLGGWMIHGQEEEKQHHRHSKKQVQDSRVGGYWALGLRKKRYVGEGAFQRRVWDVLLKSQVLASKMGRQADAL